MPLSGKPEPTFGWYLISAMVKAFITPLSQHLKELEKCVQFKRKSTGCGFIIANRNYNDNSWKILGNCTCGRCVSWSV